MQRRNEEVVVRAVADTGHPLRGAAKDFDPLLDLVGDARVVCIGEGDPRDRRVLPPARAADPAPDPRNPACDCFDRGILADDGQSTFDATRVAAFCNEGTCATFVVPEK